MKYSSDIKRRAGPNEMSHCGEESFDIFLLFDKVSHFLKLRRYLEI
jgi:hypothetical protein